MNHWTLFGWCSLSDMCCLDRVHNEPRPMTESLLNKTPQKHKTEILFSDRGTVSWQLSPPEAQFIFNYPMAPWQGEHRAIFCASLFLMRWSK